MGYFVSYRSYKGLSLLATMEIVSFVRPRGLFFNNLINLLIAPLVSSLPSPFLSRRPFIDAR
jgi:hypothetical protein